MRISMIAIILFISTSISSISIGIRAGTVGVEMPSNVGPLNSGTLIGLDIQYRFSQLASAEVAWFTGSLSPSENQKIFCYPLWPHGGSYRTGIAGLRFWLSNVYLATDFVYQYTKADWTDDSIPAECTWRKYCLGGSVALGWKILQVLDLQFRYLTPTKMLAFSAGVSIDFD